VVVGAPRGRVALGVLRLRGVRSRDGVYVGSGFAFEAVPALIVGLSGVCSAGQSLRAAVGVGGSDVAGPVCGVLSPCVTACSVGHGPEPLR